jgi:plasmid maintenance system antidote protein VapI
MDKDLKEKIEARIKAMGLKKSHIANIIGLDPVRYSQTMAGKRNITPIELGRLKSYLGIS